MNAGDLAAEPRDRAAARLQSLNRHFYDALWRDARLIPPDRFSTWPMVHALLPDAASRLEVGPGLRPRLPIAGTCFLDISAPALSRLARDGGIPVLGALTAIPFANATFDLLCAMDVVEHVDDEDAAFAELARVARPGAALIVSVPLHPARWTSFDDEVGHRRRYEPPRLLEKLAEHGFTLERSAAFGMQPRSPCLVRIGMWFLTHRRKRAIAWYNRVFMPLATRFERRLTLFDGMLETAGVDEILLLCRRTGTPRRAQA